MALPPALAELLPLHSGLTSRIRMCSMTLPLCRMSGGEMRIFVLTGAGYLGRESGMGTLR